MRSVRTFELILGEQAQVSTLLQKETTVFLALVVIIRTVSYSSYKSVYQRPLFALCIWFDGSTLSLGDYNNTLNSCSRCLREGRVNVSLFVV